jgi:aldehyde dehydrogenase (NAD+)
LFFFTGSIPTGGIIGSNCAKNHIPYILELGGKSPALITKNANISKAAKYIA